MRRSSAARILIGTVLAMAWAALVATPHLLGSASLLDPLESALIDLRHATFGPLTTPEHVVVVAVDDATLAARGGSFPFSRSKLADVIEQVVAAQPRVLVVDVLLTDEGDPEGDARLGTVLARVPSVVAAAGSVDTAGATRIPTLRDELWPRPRFAESASIGLVNLATGSSGSPQHVPLLFVTSRGLQPSIVLQAAALHAGTPPRIDGDRLHLGDRSIPLDLGAHVPLRVAGPAGTIETLSAQSLESRDVADALKGRIVVVGFTATAVGDRFATAFDEQTPGAEIIATAIAQLTGSSGLRRDPRVRRIDVGLAVLLAGLGAAVVWLRPLASGVPIALGLLGAGLSIVWIAFASGWWMSGALPLAAGTPPIAVTAAWVYAIESRRARASRLAAQELIRFQSPLVASLIARDPEFLREPERRELVILFIDLSGFTALSQTLGPERTRDLLKRFHTWVTQEVERHDGMIMNYMGDGAMAAFGVAEGTELEAADQALAAAFALAADSPSAERPETAAGPLRFRVGVHRGPVVMSRLGHDHHQQLAVTGDAVNLTSRLLELAKPEGATVAVTAELVATALNGLPKPPDLRKPVDVRGRAGPVEVLFWRAGDR